MRVIFSRKGFDASAGGYPSPILPDGRLISMPIPDSDSAYTYSDLMLEDGSSYYDLMKDLYSDVKTSNGWVQLRTDTRCHLDPDIYGSIIQRDTKWRGLFGQINASQRHLENQLVGVGDLFLFFGWFQWTERRDDRYSFPEKFSEGEHIFFGYMQIADIVRPVYGLNVPYWMDKHPHLSERRRRNRTNALYIARRKLSWSKDTPGFGVFRYDNSLVLTKKGYSRSKWELPACLRCAEISYHKGNSWREDYFQSVSRGQEFVIQKNEKVIEWVQEIIRRNAKIFS